MKKIINNPIVYGPKLAVAGGALQAVKAPSKQSRTKRTKAASDGAGGTVKRDQTPAEVPAGPAPLPDTKRIRLDLIRTDGGTQARSVIDKKVVDEYAEAMERGEKLPPVIVFADGEECYLADGFHRVEAAKKAGMTEIDAEIRHGSLKDAQWCSYGTNATHGLRRTRKDMQRAVDAALKHPRGVGLADSEIARHVGVSDKTVTTRRKKLEASSEIPKKESRSYQRKGKSCQRKASNTVKARGKAGERTAAPSPTVSPTKAIPEGEPAADDDEALLDPGAITSRVLAAVETISGAMDKGLSLTWLKDRIPPKDQVENVLEFALALAEEAGLSWEGSHA